MTRKIQFGVDDTLFIEMNEIRVSESLNWSHYLRLCVKDKISEVKEKNKLLDPKY